MRPKIPKSGKNIYLGLYIRVLGPFSYVYDVETSIFVVSLHKQKDVHEWLRIHRDDISSRLAKLM